MKYVILERKGITVSRELKDLQSHLDDGWKEVKPKEPKKPNKSKKKED